KFEELEARGGRLELSDAQLITADQAQAEEPGQRVQDRGIKLIADAQQREISEDGEGSEVAGARVGQVDDGERALVNRGRADQTGALLTGTKVDADPRERAGRGRPEQAMKLALLPGRTAQQKPSDP